MAPVQTPRDDWNGVALGFGSQRQRVAGIQALVGREWRLHDVNRRCTQNNTLPPQMILDLNTFLKCMYAMVSRSMKPTKRFKKLYLALCYLPLKISNGKKSGVIVARSIMYPVTKICEA